MVQSMPELLKHGLCRQGGILTNRTCLPGKKTYLAVKVEVGQGLERWLGLEPSKG